MKNRLKEYLFPLLITLLAVLLATLPPEITAPLMFQRDNIAAGEIWRAFSGHLLHLGWQHLLMNLAGLWMIFWFARGIVTVTEWLITLLFSSLLISLGLLLFSEITWYVGLSGLLHSLLALVALRLIEHKHREGWIILLFLLCKIIWEQWQGATPGLEQTIGGKVILEAHLYGAIAGLAIAATLPLIKRILQPH